MFGKRSELEEKVKQFKITILNKEDVILDLEKDIEKRDNLLAVYGINTNVLYNSYTPYYSSIVMGGRVGKVEKYTMEWFRNQNDLLVKANEGLIERVSELDKAVQIKKKETLNALYGRFGVEHHVNRGQIILKSEMSDTNLIELYGLVENNLAKTQIKYKKEKERREKSEKEIDRLRMKLTAEMDKNREIMYMDTSSIFLKPDLNSMPFQFRTGDTWYGGVDSQENVVKLYCDRIEKQGIVIKELREELETEKRDVHILETQLNQTKRDYNRYKEERESGVEFKLAKDLNKANARIEKYKEIMINKDNALEKKNDRFKLINKGLQAIDDCLSKQKSYHPKSDEVLYDGYVIREIDGVLKQIRSSKNGRRLV